MKHIKQNITSYYSADQAFAYLQRIKFPRSHTNNHLPPPSYENLKLLVRQHLLAFPFENSRLHYAADHNVDVSTEAVYARLVEHRQGGSWCFGQNGLLLGILRVLGYRAYAAPARANMSSPGSKEQTFSLLSHLILLVQLENQVVESVGKGSSTKAQEVTYLVDVGFGGSGLIQPILLEVGYSVPGSAPPEEHRLIRTMYPQSSHIGEEAAHEWALQFRCGSYQPDWTILFIFYEFEFFPEDWIASSQWLCQYPIPKIRDNVLAIRYFISEEEIGVEDQDKALGRLIMMGKRVDRRVGDQSVTIKEFATEQERVRILKEDFDIMVGDDEISNIVCAAAALPIR